MDITNFSEHISYVNYLTNFGIISFKNADGSWKIFLLDCGSCDKDGELILNLLNQNFINYELEAVLITHAHYDHCGGLPFITQKKGCGGWICEDEKFFMEKPLTITEMTWGGTATHELKRGYLYPKKVTKTFRPGEKFILGSDERGAVELEIIDLQGHSSAQTGFLLKDSDNKTVLFAGDAVSGKNSLSKYWVQFLLDEKRTKETLFNMSKIKADLFVPGHGLAEKDVESLVELNLIAILETEKLILRILKEPKYFDDLLKAILDTSEINMSVMRFALMGATLRSYMTNLYEEGKIEPVSIENRLCWKTKE